MTEEIDHEKREKSKEFLKPTQYYLFGDAKFQFFYSGSELLSFPDLVHNLNRGSARALLLVAF